MARISKLTQEEILEAEKASEDRKQSRKLGFEKMYERDQVMKHLSAASRINNADIRMLWHVDPELVKLPVGGLWPNIAEDKFMLKIDDKEYYFDLDEFRRWLRWA